MHMCTFMFTFMFMCMSPSLTASLAIIVPRLHAHHGTGMHDAICHDDHMNKTKPGGRVQTEESHTNT